MRYANGTVLLAGPLHGRINPDEVTWALLDYGIADTYEKHASQYLHISLEKTHLYRALWTTVLTKQHMWAQLSPEERRKRRKELEAEGFPEEELPPID